MQRVLCIVFAMSCAACAQLPSLTAKTCEVHHIRMTRQVVDKSYGAPWAYDEQYVAASASFPHWIAYVGGNSCMPPKKPKKATAYVCPECKRAAHEWALKHRKDLMAQIILEGDKDLTNR
jgi:hypothetical protein